MEKDKEIEMLKLQIEKLKLELQIEQLKRNQYGGLGGQFHLPPGASLC